MLFDLAITGAGPAGTAAALTAAKEGRKVALLERASFPRHKVCGDCLNPSLWPVLDSLGVRDGIQSLDHAALHQVRFAPVSAPLLTVPLPPQAERAVTRESFDHALLQAAMNAGVQLFSGEPLTRLTRHPDTWELHTATQSLTARTLIAADGRNSTTCRLLGLTAPATPKKNQRVALQCHAPLHLDYQGTVALELTAWGYCGIAPVDASRMNICLVSTPGQLARARQETAQRFHLPDNHAWHSLAPLDRADLPPAPFPGCYLAGDAARVVEPFTGEGIYYALRSGQLAATAALQHLSGNPDAASGYLTAHRQLYQGRLWVNRLARLAVVHPWLGNSLLNLGRHFPGILQHLTTKITAAA